jgi:hypothetical protein
MKIRIFLGCMAGFTALISNPLLAADEAVDFAKQIQPIILDTCIECHGPEKQKGKLRLDSKESSFKEDSVLVPGKADDSEFFIRVSLPKDHDDIMPAKGDPLNKDQVDLIKRWINEGAQWPDGLVIKMPEDPTKEKDPRTPIKATEAETKAIAQLAELGVQVRPVAQNVTWTLANFRSVDTNQLGNAMAHLSSIKTLEDLNLAGLHIKDEQLKSISDLVNLTHLHLEKTPVSDASLAHLAKLKNLKYLNLYNTQVTDAGLQHIKGLTNLKNIYLWETKVTDDGAKQLQAALPKAKIKRGGELTGRAKTIEAEKKAAAEKKKMEEAAKKAAEEKKKKQEAAKKAADEAKKKADEARKAADEAKKAAAEAEKKAAEAEKAAKALADKAAEK